MNLLDLKKHLDEPSIRELLSLSVGYPTPEKLSRICEQYRSLPNWKLLGCEIDGRIVGCVGLEIAGNQEATIQHVAVAESSRRSGIGRAMLDAVRIIFSLKRLAAETDADAVGFYRQCGFEIESLGELHLGVERFRCIRCVRCERSAL